MQSNQLSGKPGGDNEFGGGGGSQTGNGHKKRARGESPSSSMMSSRPPPSHGHHPHHHHHHAHHHFKDQSPTESKFYSLSSIDSRDPLEQTLEEAFSKLQNLIITSTETSASFNELTQYANQSKMHSDDVNNALLYSILTDPVTAPKCLRNLFLVSNVSSIGDQVISSSGSTNQVVLISNLLNITTENYFKLQDNPRQQLIWLIKELVKARISQFDKLLLQMLRNIQSGSLADKNIWLAESMLDILYDQTTTVGSSGSNSGGSGGSEAGSGSLWIYAYNELMTMSVYTYLRLIADHAPVSNLSQLKQRETEFCVQILRERWNDCMLIGRDLVRLLQSVGRLAEFELLFRDIVQNPSTLSPHFAQLGGLLYLMRMPTKRRCLISRLTVDMERKIYFLITSVRAGQQKRYLDWFQRQYLQTPESQSLRVDLIRYICAVVHPTNEQLNAGLVPRWSVCAWLLNTCTSPIDLANLKLALFYDWLFYDAKKDNIMLIEPAILMLFNSMRVANQGGGGGAGGGLSVSLTSMSFDFLCRIVNNFHLPLREHILNGLMQAFKDSVEKRVIPSLQGFFTAATGDKTTPGSGAILDRDLRALIQATFGNFFQTMTIGPITTPTVTPQQSPVLLPKPIFQTSPVASINTDSVSPPVPSIGVNFQPSTSVFKQQKSTSEELPEIQEPIIKIEPSNQQVSFSSDDEEVDETTSSKPQTITVPTKTPTPTTTATANPASSLGSLQIQLQQLIQRPFKIYTTIEDTLSSSSASQLDNQLNLIGSDELRDKLTELNTRLRDYYQTNYNQSKSMQISSFIRDTLSLFHKDDVDQASDLAVCFTLMFRPDFSNNLLPAQFYASLNIDIPGSTLSSKSPITDLDLISGCLLNPSYVSLVADSISQKPVFVLFKELAATANQSHEREVTLQLLSEFYVKQNRIGYYFLYYMYSVMLRLQLSTSANTSITAKETGITAATNEFTSLVRIYREFIQERSHLAQTSMNYNNDIEKLSTSTSASSTSSISSDTSSSSEKSVTSLSVSETDEDGQNEHSDDGADSSAPQLTPSDITMGACLMQDLRLCQQDDPYLFCFLLPFVCSSYLLPNYMINNSELVYLIVSCIDPRQMRDLRSSIVCEDLVLFKEPPNAAQAGGSKSKTKGSKTKKNSSLQEKAAKKRKRKSKHSKSKSSKKTSKQTKFKKESLLDVISTSLQWESIEQMFFWDLVCSNESISTPFLMPIFNRLDTNKHAEAIGFLFDILKCSEPTFDLVKMLTLRRCDDNLARSLLIAWARDGSNSDKMAQMFVRLLKMSFNSANSACSSANQSANQSSGLKTSTMKKIKYNESLSSSNKVKLTAQQQLEQNQKRNGGNMSFSPDDWDLSTGTPSLDQVLSHLNKLRLNNTANGFILTDKLLQMLRKIHQKCGVDKESDDDDVDDDTDLRKKYADLFSLAVDDFSGSQKEASNREMEGDEDNDDDNDDNDDEDDEDSSRKPKSNKRSSGTASRRGSGGKKRVGRPTKTSRKQENDGEEMVSDDEDKEDQEGNSDKDDDDSNEDDSSNDGFSKSRKGRKKASSLKRTSAKSSAEKSQQPPRKKAKQLKNSENESD